MEEAQIKLCECGCGLPAPIAQKTNTALGWTKGVALRRRVGHGRRIVNPWDVLPSGCWKWNLAMGTNGYGLTYLNGKRIPAHRLVFIKYKGEIQSGMQLDHLCRNRYCVNPEHLEIVSPAENVRRGHLTKLTANSVLEIRGKRANGESLKSLASQYGVTPAAICGIAKRNSWKEL